MGIKSHYKMFKAGKLWMTALVSAAVLGAAQVAHADQTNGTSSNQPAGDTASAISTSQTDPNASEVTLHSPKTQTLNVQADHQQDPQQAARELSENKAASRSVQTDTAQETMALAESTISVSNPSNYPTTAAKLVGKNQQGQPYYIFQIVNLVGSKINGRQARMILAVDPQNPQGTVYLYVTDDRYSKAYRFVTVGSGNYVNISVSSTGGIIPNATSNQFYRISNTAPFPYTFQGQQLELAASLSIKTNTAKGSSLRVNPVYGLGNQQNINFSDKVDISPEKTAPAIEYVYKDKNGNYTTNVNFPANVPVNGLTGQQFTITNVDNYKQVINGYYLTNQLGSLANAANGSYKGTISQFQLGKYYQKTLYNWDRTISQQLIYKMINPDGTMEISQIINGKTETVTVPAGSYKQFSNGTLARNPFVPGANSVQLVYADLGHIIPVDENGNVISTNQPIYNNDPNDPHKAGTTASPDLTAEGWVLQTPSQAQITPSNPGADTKVVYTRVVTNTEEVEVTQTVQYQYADGVTEGRPSLPADNVQTLKFTHTVVTNPVTGQVLKDTWTPAQKFTAVASPDITGFWPDQKTAGGDDNVTYETPSKVFVVNYVGPNVSTEQKTVTQTVQYKYLDGITDGRPALPASNKQTLTFTATIERNPETGEIVQTTWSPAQSFTMVQTPELEDPNHANPTGFYYANQAEAGSTAPVTHDGADTEYTVYYAAPQITQRQRVITQTVHYQYEDGVTQGRPALPNDNVQSLTFNETLATNPFTGHVVSFGWEPSHDKFKLVDSPEIRGFCYDVAQAGSTATVVPEDGDTYYVVNYAAPLTQQVEQRTVTQIVKYAYEDGITEGRPALPQTDYQELVFNRVQLINPYTNAVISDTWTDGQHFTIVPTPTIHGFYYDLPQAGSDELVTHESPNKEYEVLYFAPNELTEEKTVKQVIKYVYADGITAGRPALPADNVQTLTFTRTNKVNPNNPAEVILGQWTPTNGHFTIVSSPTINGFTYDLAEAGSDQAVTGDSADTEYIVQYLPEPDQPEPDNPTPEEPKPEEPTPEEPTPDQPVPDVPTDHPTTGIRPTKPAAKPELPQTGNDASATLAALGLVAGMLGLGLGKRKRN